MNPRKLRAIPYLLVLFPLDVLVAACLLTASLFRRRPQLQPEAALPRSPAGRRGRATIQILNWDGRHLLEECMPAVREAVRAAGGGHDILVVDNGSKDDSVAFLRQRFPEVRVLELDRNYGFVTGNNKGVETLDTEFVVLLNNDMVVDRGFLAPLLAGFSDNSVFAVTSQILFEDRKRRREETGKTRARYDRGFFTLWHDDIAPADESRATLPVFWAGGGSCAFDREKYCRIGGLDDLYHPFYVEDADLSYQAWKRGWKCLLAPASLVVHKHRATSSRRFSHRFVDNTIRRNLFLFVWKNVTDFPMVLQHVMNLPRIHGRAVLQNEGWFELQAYGRALLRFPAALRRRWRASAYLLTDREVLLRSQQ